MSPSPASLTLAAAWAATGLGVGLWLWGLVREKNPIRRQRFNDCGVALVFTALLARVLIEGGALDGFDWFVIVLAPVFILLSLWRLTRTQGGPTE